MQQELECHLDTKTPETQLGRDFANISIFDDIDNIDDIVQAKAVYGIYLNENCRSSPRFIGIE